MRKVTRKYKRYNKQTGMFETVTKEYTYSHKSTKGKVLVSKKGVVYKKNVEAFKSKINDMDIPYADKRFMLNQLEEQVNVAHKNRSKMDTNGFLGRLEEDKISRYFTNMGYSLGEVADQLGLGFDELDELLEESNWDRDVFSYGGKSWRFAFTYSGELFTEVI